MNAAALDPVSDLLRVDFDETGTSVDAVEDGLARAGYVVDRLLRP